MHHFINWVLLSRLVRRLYLYAYFILSLSITATAETNAVNNPFQANEELSQPPQQSQEIDPLKAYPAAQYVVQGVIVMADNAVAVVHSPRNTWHKVHVQSHLGSEDAVVQKISTKGIQIETQGTLLWLPIPQ